MKIKCIIGLLFATLSLNLQAQLNINGGQLVEALTNPTDTVVNEKYNNRNTHYINVSIGFFNPVDFAFSLANVNSVSGSPSPSLNLDYNYGISSSLSIGAFANYYQVNAQYTPNIAEIETILDQSITCTDGIGSIDDILNAIGCINEQISSEITIEERLNVYTVGAKLSVHKRWLPKIDTYAATYLGLSFNSRENFVENALKDYADELFNRSSVEVPKLMYLINAGARYYITPNIGIYGEFGYGNVHLAKLGATYRF